tara:strand:+ start:131 stop:988 length:858 start_codon:yes stop_codon:yes gene_type:complete
MKKPVSVMLFYLLSFFGRKNIIGRKSKLDPIYRSAFKVFSFCTDPKIYRKAKFIYDFHSFDLTLNVNDYTQAYYFFNRFEHDDLAIMESFRKFADPNGTMVDVGANVGLYSCLSSFYFAAVLSFEIHPETFSSLINNSSQRDNITPFNLGLSDRESSVWLKYVEHNSGNCSIEKNTDFEKEDVKQAQTITLDAFINESRIRNISFIKIDVEGHEKKVLEGAESTLAQYKPVLLVETSGFKEFRDIFLLLKNTYIPINPYSFEELKVEDYRLKQFENVVFIPRKGK